MIKINVTILRINLSLFEIVITLYKRGEIIHEIYLSTNPILKNKIEKKIIVNIN
jgi:hypothetical protein